LQRHRNSKFLRLKHLLSMLKKLQAQLMKIRLLKKLPGLKKFQLLKSVPGQPSVLRLKINPGQLKNLLCLKKLHQLHLLLLQNLQR
jgi:hypothetical protein